MDSAHASPFHVVSDAAHRLVIAGPATVSESPADPARHRRQRRSSLTVWPRKRQPPPRSWSVMGRPPRSGWVSLYEYRLSDVLDHLTSLRRAQYFPESASFRMALSSSASASR